MTYEFDGQLFAKYIRLNCERFTWQEFAKLTGLSHATICRFLRAKGTFPEMRAFLAICNALSVDYDVNLRRE